MRRTLLLALFLSSPLLEAAGFEYGMISIIEARTSLNAKPKVELIVRADLNSGNDFFCREQTDDLPTAKQEQLWLSCISKLIEQTPGTSITDVPEDAVYYEPIVLSLFGRLGWEVYDVSESTLDNPAMYSVTTLFRVRRTAEE